jgi:hypothetical protein
MPDDRDDQETADDQSTMEPAGNDQPTDQSDEQPTGQADQAGSGAESQSTTESDQPGEQADETSSGESEQPVQVAEAGGEQATEGDGGATDGVASDAVAAAGGAGTTKIGTRNLKVAAEFTEEGQKFIGDILIHVFESDNGQQGRLLFPTTGQFWQNTIQKGNVITTPELRVSTSEILVFAHARVLLPTGDYQTMDTQDLRIPLPSGDTLQLKVDVGVGEVDVKVNAPDADAAIAKALQSPQLKGHLVKGDLKAESVGNQQFRVTGKFLSGDITLL